MNTTITEDNRGGFFVEQTSSEVTHDEIVSAALKHYEELSTKCHHWSSSVVHALEFWRRYGPNPPITEADRLRREREAYMVGYRDASVRGGPEPIEGFAAWQSTHREKEGV